MAETIETVEKPGNEPTVMDLLVRDRATDKKIFMVLRQNLTAMKGYLSGVNNLQVRDAFRAFLVDTHTVVSALERQCDLQLDTLGKMRKRWRTQQEEAAKQQKKSAPTAAAPESTSRPSSDSSAPPAVVQAPPPPAA